MKNIQYSKILTSTTTIIVKCDSDYSNNHLTLIDISALKYVAADKFIPKFVLPDKYTLA